tara:strand:+ start:844 stop:2133 length:1290 start_codon:yes stop_codon:yes gene_type:complete
MTVKIYKDDNAMAIFIEDNNGAQFLNNLHAFVNDPADTVFHIKDKARDNLVLTNLSASAVVDENEQVYGADVPATVNALNALFSVSGGSAGNAPEITSATAVNLTAGDTLNYELVATYGVGYEWTGLPAGVTTVEGNSRKLIGGSGLSPATYTITATAINYFGQTSETISLVVSAPPFSNTKSVNFQNQDWLGANAALLDAELGRSGNGSGSGDAWSISLWFKPSTASQGQTIFYAGDNDANNGGYIQVMQLDNGGNKALRLRYGSNNNSLHMQTVYGSLVPNVWNHILISYDGGTTGSSSADMDDYYGRFQVFIDGALQSRSDSHVSYGYTGGVDMDNLRVGRNHTGGNYMRGCRVDELAIWGSDQSGNVADIYNGGAPFDLDTLSPSPDHWWRMGDGDTYPNIQDTVGNAHFVMYNMTAADIVTDAP